MVHATGRVTAEDVTLLVYAEGIGVCRARGVDGCDGVRECDGVRGDENQG